MAELAILGGAKTREASYPECPIYDERDIEAVTRVIRRATGAASPIRASKPGRFIEAFLKMQGGELRRADDEWHGTMEVALRAADVGWGDEVLVPAYTFQATAAAPMAAGAIPVIVDIDPNTYCIDPKAAEAAITERTRAIIPVHLGAQMADMDAIMALAEKYNLIVVEDCAHAHGAKWRGQRRRHDWAFRLLQYAVLQDHDGGRRRLPHLP